MKLLTVMGTRPEIIRLSAICSELDKHCDQTILHTGQNLQSNLKELFFDELSIRPPDLDLGITSKDTAGQIGNMFAAIGESLDKLSPDKVLILGDTNSALVTSILSARYGIPSYHMEAGNRCFDTAVPEEINRKIIDHVSYMAMPYTQGSKENLVREGISQEKILVTGNPINQVMNIYRSKIDASNIHKILGITDRNYFLVTVHRAENVDNLSRLHSLVNALDTVGDRFEIPVIVSLHPRTKDRMEVAQIIFKSSWVRSFEPLGFCDFVALEKNSLAVITDSGTVQEECCILGVPTVTVRDSTERPETIECGSNILAGVNPSLILNSLNAVLTHKHSWTPPQEYLRDDVSHVVKNIVLGYT